MRVWAIGLIGSIGLVATAGCGDDEAERAAGDADADGWFAPADCDDADASVFPGADEVAYDGVDQDCSGSDLTDVDGDGFDGAAHAAGGAAGASGRGDEDAADCDDTRPDVNPAAVEVCGDSIDQDCSGMDLACDDADLDGDGVTANAGDCNDLALLSRKLFHC
jgi:hypothetical protein